EVDADLFTRSEGEHEELVQMIKSLCQDERKDFSVNVPNEGAVKGLPDNAVLELPAIATACGFRPMIVNDFPDTLKGIIARRLAPVEVTVQAALSGDKKLWADAMLLDGAVSDVKIADQIVEDFIAEYGQYLPQYK
ncbi:MAG: hypothetical protein RR612_11035, partial [Oscillospiraceae bacterium]